MRKQENLIRMQYRSYLFKKQYIINDIDNAIKIINDRYIFDHISKPKPGMTFSRLEKYLNIFNSRYIDKKGINEIALEYNCSSMRVRQIINKIIALLIHKYGCK